MKKRIKKTERIDYESKIRKKMEKEGRREYKKYRN